MSRILVVEDDEVSQEVVTIFLQRDGYKVLHAVDGAAGVALAQKELPDLILMDIDLPELDGCEATRRIRANPRTAAIPIIALTAHASSEDVQNAMGAGCNQYETKPVVHARLMKKIEGFLNS